jgi:hypothetical protein
MPWWAVLLIGLVVGAGLARWSLAVWRSGFAGAMAATYRAVEAVEEGAQDIDLDFDAQKMLVVLEDVSPRLWQAAADAEQALQDSGVKSHPVDPATAPARLGQVRRARRPS